MSVHRGPKLVSLALNWFLYNSTFFFVVGLQVLFSYSYVSMAIWVVF